MNITVNGTVRHIDDTATLADLVTGITGHTPDDDRLGVAVALDATVVPRSRWATTGLHADAEIEIITAMQGG